MGGLNLVEVKAGDVIFISGAAGAVGNVAGQLAKLRGCRVIGSAGSMEKVKFLRDECGFDIAFNYQFGPVAGTTEYRGAGRHRRLFRQCGRRNARGGALGFAGAWPDHRLRRHLRLQPGKAAPGPANLFNIITKRLTMKGFIVRDWLDRQAEFEKEVGGYFKAGKVKHKETVVKGIDQAVGAFIGLFPRANIGKMVVELGSA